MFVYSGKKCFLKLETNFVISGYGFELFKFGSATAPLKGQSDEIFDNFLNQKTPPRPHINRQNGFAKFFVSAKIFYRKVQKSLSP